MWEMIVNALGESETNNIVITKVILKMEKAIEKLVEKGKTYEEILEYTFGIEEYFNIVIINDDNNISSEMTFIDYYNDVFASCGKGSIVFSEDKVMLVNEDNQLIAIYQQKDEFYVKPYRMFL